MPNRTGCGAGWTCRGKSGNDGPAANAERLGVLPGLAVRADERDRRVLLAIARHYDGEMVVRPKFVIFVMEPYKQP